ncbi:MAG: Lipoprotein-releasing system ATP-binding protein LolD [Chlamydiae bacterium]|nr:Lipoprotein-releasing system ATP-binding protein LolD [Chlamydiota bacterium]
MTLAVQCQDIKKTYGKGGGAVQALRGVDLEVNTGELLMLVGPSGSGKTTLLSVISGILNQDSGKSLIFGENLNAMPNDKKTFFRGKNIGFVFQAFNLVPMLTATENAAIPLILRGEPLEEALNHAQEQLIRVRLGHRLNALPPNMSLGEQQRIAIARGCIHSPRLIVCDEPTSALDHETGHKVLEIFKEIALSQECALIIVTHDARIFEFADRILKMDDGRIVGEQNNNH